MSSQPLKLPYGLRADGRLVHVGEVERGAACGCRCPACHRPLVARKGRVRVPHFSHEADLDCEYAVETALHLAAKDILARRRALMVPPGNPFKPVGMMRAVPGLAAVMMAFDDVRIEQREGSVVPDGIALAGRSKLLIEIRVSHRVDDEKLARLRALGHPAIEVNLSKVDRRCLPEDPERIIVDGVKEKRWLVDPVNDLAVATIPQFQGRVFALRAKPGAPPFVACPATLWQNIPLYTCRDCVHCLGIGPDPMVPEWTYCRLVGEIEPGWYPKPRPPRPPAVPEPVDPAAPAAPSSSPTPPDSSAS